MRDDWRLFREWTRGDGDTERAIADLSRPGALTAALNWYRASWRPDAELRDRRPFPSVAARHARALERPRPLPRRGADDGLRRVRGRRVALRADRGREPLDAARRARAGRTRCCSSWFSYGADDPLPRRALRAPPARAGSSSSPIGPAASARQSTAPSASSAQRAVDLGGRVVERAAEVELVVVQRAGGEGGVACRSRSRRRTPRMPPGAQASTAARHASGRPTASNTTSQSASRLGAHRPGRLGLRAALGVAVGERDRAALVHEQRGEHLAHRAAAEHAGVGRELARAARGRSRGRRPRAARPSRRRRRRARPGPRAARPPAPPAPRRSRRAPSAVSRQICGRPARARRGTRRRRPSRPPARARRCPRARPPSRGRSAPGRRRAAGWPRRHIFTSVPQVVAASIRTTTSPAAGHRVRRPPRRAGPRGRSRTAALTAARPPSAPRRSRCAASAAPVSSSGKRAVMSSSGVDRAALRAARAPRACRPGPADQLAVTSSSRMNTVLPSIAERAAGRRRRVDAQRAAGRERLGGARRSRPGAAVQTIATSTGSLPCAVAPQRSARASRSGRGSRTHTASTPRACAAAMCSSPLQPGADHEQASPGRDARAALGAQRAGERLGEGREHRVEPVERQQLADELGLDPHVLGEAAGVEAGRAEALAQRLVAAAAAAALAARRVVVDRHAVADRDAVDARADLDHLAGRLVAEHRGQLAARRRSLHVGAAGRAREHAADDLAGPGRRGPGAPRRACRPGATVRATLTPPSRRSRPSPAARRPARSRAPTRARRA